MSGKGVGEIRHHYIADATRCLTGEPGVLIVYASSLRDAKQVKGHLSHLLDFDGNFSKRRPTPEEWARVQELGPYAWFSGFVKEEEEVV